MQYLVAILVPIALLIFFNSGITSQKSAFRYSLISALGMYLISIFTVFVISTSLDSQLAKFDLNHDNIFEGKEQTLAQQAAMDAVTNDIGRNLTFVLAAPWSLLVSFSIFIPLGFWRIKKTKDVNH